MNYIIYAPSYKEDSGGIIVLHKLCHLLNEMGEKAFLWPDRIGMKSTLRKRIRNSIMPKEFVTVPEYNSPRANSSDLHEDSIVIYSETVAGNPLSARNVVRWLLHKPGFHSGVVEYGDNELYFVFDDNCIEPGYNIDPENKLFILGINSAYKNENKADRIGSCFMMRKGVGRQLIHDMEDSVQIDGFDHQLTAKTFNKVKYFYCYDEFTLYSQYAALCGCISIVIPETFNSRGDWVDKHPISKYGIAYGLGDIEHAVATQGLVADYFRDLENESQQTVSRFIEVTKKAFGA